jgi:hypothetical protein
MKFPIFASFILFCLFLQYNMFRNNKLERKSKAAFWEMENEANATRKQPLTNLNYISFPYENFTPAALLGDEDSARLLRGNSEAVEITAKLLALSGEKMVNLGGMTNTQLKLNYGAANFPALSEYDQNYSDLITLLQEYAALLSKGGYPDQALTVAEYAVSIGSDIPDTYRLCLTLYGDEPQPEKIAFLQQHAGQITSFRKQAIGRILQESGQYSD